MYFLRVKDILCHQCKEDIKSLSLEFKKRLKGFVGTDEVLKVQSRNKKCFMYFNVT